MANEFVCIDNKFGHSFSRSAHSPVVLELRRGMWLVVWTQILIRRLMTHSAGEILNLKICCHVSRQHAGHGEQDPGVMWVSSPSISLMSKSRGINGFSSCLSTLQYLVSITCGWLWGMSFPCSQQSEPVWGDVKFQLWDMLTCDMGDQWCKSWFSPLYCLVYCLLNNHSFAKIEGILFI